MHKNCRDAPGRALDCAAPIRFDLVCSCLIALVWPLEIAGILTGLNFWFLLWAVAQHADSLLSMRE